MITLQLWMVMFAIWPFVVDSSSTANQRNTECKFVGLLCESLTLKKSGGKYLVYSITHISCSRVNNEGQMEISKKPQRKELTVTRQDLGSVNVEKYAAGGMPGPWSKQRILIFSSIKEAVVKTWLEHCEIQYDKSENTTFYSSTRIDSSQYRQTISPAEKGYTRLTAGKDTIYVKRYELKKTWDEALKVCRSDGGSLVKIDTKEKMEQVTETMSRNDDLFKKFHMWIALRDFEQNNVFRWIDGSFVNYSAWAKHEPHNVLIDEFGTWNEDCGVLVNNLFNGLKWNDHNCGRKNGFLCEITQI